MYAMEDIPQGEICSKLAIIRQKNATRAQKEMWVAFKVSGGERDLRKKIDGGFLKWTGEWWMTMV